MQPGVLHRHVQDLVARSTLSQDAPAPPPLPSVLGLAGLLDSALVVEPVVHFKAGNTHQLIAMQMDVFRGLVASPVTSFAQEFDLHTKCASWRFMRSIYRCARRGAAAACRWPSGRAAVCRPLTTMLKSCGLNTPYCMLRHPPAATGSEAAKAVHFPGHCTLKAVIVKLDGQRALCAIPCNRTVDLVALRKVAGAATAELVPAAELRVHVPATQVRALPHRRTSTAACC